MKEQTSYSDKRKRAIVILILLLLLLAFFGSFFFIRGRINANAADQSGISDNTNGEINSDDNKNSSDNNTTTNGQLPVVDTNQSSSTNQSENIRRNNSNSRANGNQNAASNVEPDTTAPEITGIENGKYYAGKVTATINADDLASAKCKFEAEDGTTTEFDFTTGHEFTESGKYTLTVKDESGNTTELTFTIDLNNPNLKINDTIYEDGTETIYANDTEFKIENTDKNADKAYLDDEELSDEIIELTEGTHTIKLTDKAGNEKVYTIVVDRTAPVLTWKDVEYTDGSTIYANETFVVNATDANEIAEVAPNGHIRYNGWRANGEGKYTIKVTDIAGNVATFTVIVDKTAPILNLNGTSYTDSSKTIYSNATEFTAEVEDVNADKVYVNDEEKTEPFTLEEGTYSVKVTDLAGNETVYTLVVDRTNPTLKLNGTSYTDSSKTIYSNATEFTAEVEDVNADKVYVNDEEKTELFTLEEGTYTVKVTDLAGNETVYTLVVDRTAPVLTICKFEKEYTGRTELEADKIYNYSLAVVIDEINLDTAKLEADDNTVVDYVSKTEIGARKDYTLTVTDLAGNVSTISFGIDKDAPKIEGVENGKYYNVDVTPVVTDKHLDKVTYTFNDAENDFAEGTVFTAEGKYTITATDLAGNKTTKTFYIDKTAPVLEIKADSVGTDPYYSRISFKLKDNMGFVKYILNGKVVEPTIATAGDANYGNIKDKLHQGENTMILVDQAGNETTKTFIYDTIAPVLTLCKFEKEHTGRTELEADKIYNYSVAVAIEEVNPYTAKLLGDDNSVVDYTSKTEIGARKDYTLTVTDLAGNVSTISFGIDKDAPKIEGVENGKYYNVDVTPVVTDKHLDKVTYTFNDAENDFAEGTVFTAEGKYTITATDLAGNKTTKTFYIDKTAPVLEIKADSVGTDPYYSRISFKLNDNMGFVKYILNGNVTEPTIATTGDANYGNIKDKLHQGENTMILIDQAGNETTKTFIYDTVAPTLTVKDDSIGIDPNYSKISFSLYDNKKFNNYYTINGTKITVTPAQWGDANFTTLKSHLNQGENTIELVDMAGNKATKTFIYDTVAPTATVTYSNNNGYTLTNQDVTATLTASEEIRDLDGWTRVDEKTFTKVFDANTKSSVEIVDLAGNKSSINYEVKRIDKIAPTITLNGNATENVTLNDSYTDAGITISDNIDKVADLKTTVTITWDSQTGTVETVDAVDTSVEGIYTIEYKVTDKAGNTATATRTVYVQR